MPIPLSQSHDVVLVYLTHRGDMLANWLPVEQIAGELMPFFVRHQAQGFVFNPHPPAVPTAFRQAIDSLERKRYIETDLDGRIRLTGLGAFVGHLHEVPEDLCDRADPSR